MITSTTVSFTNCMASPVYKNVDNVSSGDICAFLCTEKCMEKDLQNKYRYRTSTTVQVVRRTSTSTAGVVGYGVSRRMQKVTL